MFGGIVFILYLCTTNNDKMESNRIHTLKVIPHIKKYMKKHPMTGVIQRKDWYRFEYRITSVKFIDDYYEWNRHIEVNISISERYGNRVELCWEQCKNVYYHWSSSRRRNQYIRNDVQMDIKTHLDMFSLPYRVFIKTIKVVD